MVNNLKILGARSGMIGDTVMLVGILPYLKKKFPDCYITWVIAKNFSQSAPIYINHPLIDQIYICDGPNDNLSEEEQEKFKDYDIKINLTPQHPSGESWYGKYTCVEETLRMAYGDWAQKYLGLNSPDELLSDFKNTLSEQEQKPRLYKWWKDVKPFERKTIGIWPCAGYNKAGLARNPSVNFYQDLIWELNKEGCAVAIFGHPNDFKLCSDYNFVEKSFFEQIQISLETDLIIGTDSGSGWVCGAYGIPQISLIRDGYPSGRPDFWPLAPENWAEKNIVLTSCGDWSSLSVEKVLERVEEHGV